MAAGWAPRVGVAGVGLASLAGYAWGVPRVAGAETPHQAYVILFGALFVLYVAAAAGVLRWAPRDPAVVGLVLGFGLLFRVAVLPTPVFLSSDVHRYLWDGRVQWAGISPYRHPPAAPELAPLRDREVFPQINRPAARTVYPPGGQLVFAAVFGLAPDSLLAWRLFLLGCEVATGVLLLDLLRRMRRPPAAVVVYAWAPLAVFEAVQAAHLEAVWVPLALLALRWRQAGRMVAAGLALGAATLVKLVPAILLVAWWRRGDRRLPAAWVGMVTAGYLLYVGGAGSTVLGFLPQYFGSGEDFNIGLRFFLTGWIPFGSDGAREAVRGVTMLALVAVLGAVLWRIGRARTEEPAAVLEATAAAAGAYLLLMPTALHAWYVLWMVPLLALRPSPAWLWLSGAVSLSYLKYAWDPAGFPLWVRLVEFVPLYALLLREWGAGARIRGAVPAWRPAGASRPS